jgi:dTDP-4-amino-4,6-dideoxygalactose transaminase
MLTAISRYGARIIPNTEETIAALRGRGELIQGPAITEFARAFAARVGAQYAIPASFGRVAFYYLLKAYDFPHGSEIVVPALTFRVMPELARAAGLKVVFADVDTRTFTLDPESLAKAITPNTRAVVPTHLYGLPCDMGPILSLARQHRLVVIEDCAHALGATWQGQTVGSIGDAAIFSFQLLKPLNTYGGGMAVTSDPAIAARVRALAEAERWPTEDEVMKRLWLGRVQRIAIKPEVFTWSLFPMLWAGSYLQANPDVYLWEKIRPLDPMPASYRTRYTNVQAAIGLEGLTHIDEWTARTVAHANAMTAALAWAPVQPPVVPPDRTHVFYQYCLYAENRDQVVKQCIRRGIDVETLHVDVCTRLELFGGGHRPAPGAEQAAAAIQVPVHAALSDDEISRIARTLRDSAVAVAS